MATASVVVPGTAIIGQLTPASATEAYQFDASFGDLFYFDQLILTGGSPRWRLLDPYGRIVFGPTSFADVSIQTVEHTGVYTLLIEGRVTDVGETVDYSFNVEPRGNVPIAPLPTGAAITVGTTISDALNTTDSKDYYSFTLADPAQLYFDSLTNSSAFMWNLNGPRGATIERRSFMASDAERLGGNPLMALVPGDYVLSVEGSAPGAYSFRRDWGAFSHFRSHWPANALRWWENVHWDSTPEWSLISF